MKRFTSIIALFTLLFIGMSCENDDENNVSSDLEVQNFIWKGLNAYYLWQQEIPDLADTRFSSQEQLNAFLEGKDPEELFYSGLLNDYPNVDQYSWIVDDYIALSQQLNEGISGTNGVEFGLVFETGSDSDIYGYVKYIIPGSDAAGKNIQRGDIFHAVNGSPLTTGNYRQLLFMTNSYTLNLADYNNGIPTDNGISVDLTISEVQENPILTSSVIEVSDKKIGYIMYNGFTNAFDTQLNDVFGSFKSDGITDLVVDLRYNPGGSVRTATYLASMITGQFNDELFIQERWNDKWQTYFEENRPDLIINNFVDQIEGASSINSLTLSKVVILTTESSASASELVINGLKPYIDVTTIGETTEGKIFGSVTLYDSDNYRIDDANPNHTWAMQPLVLEVQNKLGENQINGITPDILFPENRGNLGILGQATEPLLERAISFITTGNRGLSIKKGIETKEITNSKRETQTGSNMYFDKELFLNELF